MLYTARGLGLISNFVSSSDFEVENEISSNAESMTEKDVGEIDEDVSYRFLFPPSSSDGDAHHVNEFGIIPQQCLPYVNASKNYIKDVALPDLR